MVNMRPFNDFEQKNIKFLVNHNVKFTQVEITPTGLKKSILDSTSPMRTFFYEADFHDYQKQLQGIEHRIFRNAVILTSDNQHTTKVSLYRPVTKKGDPRMWIYDISRYTSGSDIHVLFVFDSILYSINITKIDIEECYYSGKNNPIKEIISEIYHISNSVSDELLSKFLAVKGQWFESEIFADTGIGRTIESSLGIKMNSEKTPDYKGIELKSHRDKRSSNKNVLFTQTPDWDLSALKSGREIVEKYGYLSENGEKTYQSTVKAFPPNKQLLFLNVNLAKEWLELQAQNREIDDIAVWQLIKLHERLLIKHHETFWIEVQNQKNDGKEYFRYKRIEHTKNPIVSQFDILLGQNYITLDMLLCRPSGNGDTYSFKIKKKGMPLLFPENKVYDIL